MSGDYSRQRFNPRNNFSGVFQQQGRVQLDADWNELVEILDRRLRAETVDIMGRCVVPRETENGFKIVISDGNLTIGCGRIYVDGLLAENHGYKSNDVDLPKGFFDTVLAEKRGEDPISYTEQPYYKKDKPIAAKGRYLVYIDVWQRETTHLEEPGLVEQAVGIDATTRLQTVWKVEALEIDSNVTCATPEGEIKKDGVKNWQELIKPSAGRLTTATVPVAETEPCHISPGGGYRGLENQLYRVEIHEKGPAGKARFKWSRDNASVATTVQEINGTELTVERVAWDSVRRFSCDDWVEITCDSLEFEGEPGFMRQIAEVDDGTRIITLKNDLTGFPAQPRNMRIRRWDQKEELDSDGLIPVPNDGNPVPLENGITVAFNTEPLDGNFKTGDYWVFYARTEADGSESSVEELRNAPPRGIHHHYGKLAIVDFSDESFFDCRTKWPPEAGKCCCTITVGDGVNSNGRFNDLGEAIKSLDPKSVDPVRICLLPGSHRVFRAIDVNRHDVTITGCGKQSLVESNGTVFHIAADNITLENFCVKTEVKTSVECLIKWSGSKGQMHALDLRHDGPGVLAEDVKSFVASKNVIFARPVMSLQGENMKIERNSFIGGGLEFKGSCAGIRVVENLVAAGVGSGITMGPDGSNKFNILKEITIERNHIKGMAGSGIRGLKPVFLANCRIENNVIEGCACNIDSQEKGLYPQGGIVLGATGRLLIRHNLIQRNGTQTTAQVFGIYAYLTLGMEIADNQVIDNGTCPEKIHERRGQGGIYAVALAIPATKANKDELMLKGSYAAAITGNTIISPGTISLQLVGAGPMKVTDNRFVSHNNAGLSMKENEKPPLQEIVFKQDVYVGAVRILNLGLPAFFDQLPNPIVKLLASFGGTVQFSGNQTMLGMDPGQTDTWQPLGALILTLGDLAMTANQTESRLWRCRQRLNTLSFGMTARAATNSYAENVRRCGISLLSLGALLNTTTDNQATSCIFAYASQVVKSHNLSLFCMGASNSKASFTSAKSVGGDDGGQADRKMIEGFSRRLPYRIMAHALKTGLEILNKENGNLLGHLFGSEDTLDAAKDMKLDTEFGESYDLYVLSRGGRETRRSHAGRRAPEHARPQRSIPGEWMIAGEVSGEHAGDFFVRLLSPKNNLEMTLESAAPGDNRHFFGIYNDKDHPRMFKGQLEFLIDVVDADNKALFTVDKHVRVEPGAAAFFFIQMDNAKKK